MAFEAEQGAWPVSGRSGHWGEGETDEVRFWEHENIVKMDAETDRGFDWIAIELSNANGTPLTTGTYSDVRNRQFHPEGPGILVISNGFGCGEDYASFTISRIDRDESGTLTALDASVEQRCGDPAGPAFHARLHYVA